MKGKTLFLFELFTNNANKRLLHPQDWDRFYNFISHCERYKQSVDDLQEKLSKKGFSKIYAREITFYFEKITAFIRWKRRTRQSSGNVNGIS